MFNFLIFFDIHTVKMTIHNNHALFAIFKIIEAIKNNHQYLHLFIKLLLLLLST